MHIFIFNICKYCVTNLTRKFGLILFWLRCSLHKALEILIEIVSMVLLVMFVQNRFLDDFFRFFRSPNTMRLPTEMEEQKKCESKKHKP